MQRCELHENSKITPASAWVGVKLLTELFDGSAELFAEGIVDLDRAPCCAYSGYARSLMKAAFRELLQGEAKDHECGWVPCANQPNCNALKNPPQPCPCAGRVCCS